eukprot:g55903.t1
MWTYVSSNTGDLWKVWLQLLTRKAIRQDMDKAVIEGLHELHWVRKDKPGLLQEMRDLVETLKHCKLKHVAPTLKEFLVTQKKWCCEEKLKEDIVALASTVDVFNMKGSVEDPDWEGLTNLVPELKTALAQKAFPPQWISI